MAIGAPAERPVELAIAFRDRQIVDACNPAAHQALGIELPVLVAVTAVPLAAIVVPLVGESNGDAVAAERPQFFDKAVVEFATPLPGEEGLDFRAAGDEFGAVAPDAVRRIGQGDLGGVAPVPRILGKACF